MYSQHRFYFDKTRVGRCEKLISQLVGGPFFARYYIDTSYYGGMLDKSHEDFYRYIMLYPAIAFFFHCIWCRIKDNDKDNFLAKWRVPAEEA